MNCLDRGFTLLELMVTLVIVAILAAIAIPSYKSYVLRANASAAEQSMKQLAVDLERYKTKNFSYLNYPTTSMTLPAGATGTAVKYTITVKDGADTSKNLTDTGITGRSWSMQAVAASGSNNYTYLLTSIGQYCRNKTAANVTYATCGTGAQTTW